jgi:hypothetical protein
MRTIGLLAGVLLAGSAGGAAAETRQLLVTKASWADGAGNQGTMIFQGEVTDGVLSGRAYPGNGTELVVSGTVGLDGSVNGSLLTSEGQDVADFSAQLNAAQELEGEITIDGEAAAEWVAPAEDLPAS